MIRFSSVAKRYPGGHEALRDINLEVASGEMVAVTGHSGAGKSTLLKLAAGIERASSGSIVVQGQNLGALGETALAVLRRRIGFVFQDHKLIVNRPSMLVADEPTGNLDADYGRVILGLFASFNQVGVTVLLSTHDEAALAAIQCRRVALAAGALTPAAR